MRSGRLGLNSMLAHTRTFLVRVTKIGSICASRHLTLSTDVPRVDHLHGDFGRVHSNSVAVTISPK